jgi:dolichol kinase
MKSQKFQQIIFVSLLLAIAGCTSQAVRMIQPQTGATAECSGSSYGFGPLFTESFVDSCTRAYENRGYVALQRLTPEDRARLEQRGLLPKD